MLAMPRNLKELFRLQKERVITIKAADKGAGIVILDFKEYMKSCYEHLLSSVPNEKQDKAPEMYYKAVNKFALEEAKDKLLNVLEEALEKQIISKEEYNFMNPEEKIQQLFIAILKSISKKKT